MSLYQRLAEAMGLRGDQALLRSLLARFAVPFVAPSFPVARRTDQLDVTLVTTAAETATVTFDFKEPAVIVGPRFLFTPIVYPSPASLAGIWLKDFEVAMSIVSSGTELYTGHPNTSGGNAVSDWVCADYLDATNRLMMLSWDKDGAISARFKFRGRYPNTSGTTSGFGADVKCSVGLLWTPLRDLLA